MSIANEISKAQNNLKDCYDVCKSVDGVVLPDDKNFDNLPALIEQALNPFNKPADWSDIRVDCPVNSIALYAGHTPLQQWTLGDRLDNKATFVGYFDSVDPDTNTAQRYAYFVLDAAYRSTSKVKDNTNYVLSADSPIPVNATYTEALARTESATYNCTKLEAAGTFPTVDFAKAVSVNYNGTTYYGVIPNATELLEIYNNRETLDTYDPTITDYTTLSLTEWASGQSSRVWTSNGANSSAENGLTFWQKKKTGTGSNAWYLPGQNNNLNFSAAAFPIIEIPVDNSNIQYDNLGFTATCTGGYKVYIDGNVYGSYASGSTCNITWSTSGIITGDDITTPSTLKAHKIWIEPATEGNNITAFQCKRVAASGTEEQGVLWGHFNISNSINYNFGTDSVSYVEKLLRAITAKNNVLTRTFTNFSYVFFFCETLEYLPVLDFSTSSTNPANFYSTFRNCYKLKEIVLKFNKFSNLTNAFRNASLLSKIKSPQGTPYSTSDATYAYWVYNGEANITQIIDISYNNITSLANYITNATKLKDMILDVSSATGLTEIGCYGTSTYFMSGFKGLRVSNEAPFNNATAPQINVSYTGMDRNALVQLFNDLPYNVGYEVVGSPTINSGVVSGFTTSDYTKTSLSLSSDNEKIRIKIRFKTPETFVSGNTNILTFGNSLTTNNCIRIYTGSSYSRISSFGNDINTGSPNLQTDTWYVADILIDDNKQYSYLYDDNNTKLAESTNTTKTANFNNIGLFGGRFYSPIQAIDFNNTSIEVYDIPFFRGQAAMTKTLSCVGCTGTADLTADDKDIALNKGWSLTLS